MFWPSRLDFLLKKIKLPVPIDTWERRARPAMPAGLRLIITEGPRFPQLAAFHYREVLYWMSSAPHRRHRRRPGSSMSLRVNEILSSLAEGSRLPCRALIPV